MKSTIVRIIRTRGRLADAALPWLLASAPDVGARWLIDRFATPRRAPGALRRDEPPALGVPATPLALRRDTLALYGQGPGAPVLLVHGWEGSADDMATAARALARAGFRAVAFDLPAHGRSTGRRLTLPDAARAVRRVAESLGPLAGVVGHSLGAAATLLALRDGLDARCAVAIAPPRRVAPFLAQFARERGIGARHDAAIRRALEARVGPLDALDADRAARAVELPGLVVHDVGDRVVPFADGLAVADAWDGARLVAAEGLGHRRILHDEATVAEVVRFVLERSARGPAVEHGGRVVPNDAGHAAASAPRRGA